MVVSVKSRKICQYCGYAEDKYIKVFRKTRENSRYFKDKLYLCVECIEINKRGICEKK